MNLLIAGVVLWMVCGFFGWGLTVAYWTREYPGGPIRGDLVFAGCIALLGPIGLFAAVIGSNFGQHGLRWRCGEEKARGN